MARARAVTTTTGARRTTTWHTSAAHAYKSGMAHGMSPNAQSKVEAPSQAQAGASRNAASPATRVAERAARTRAASADVLAHDYTRGSNARPLSMTQDATLII